MAEGKLYYQGKEYYPRRVVCITVVPSYNQPEYAIDDALEVKLIDLLSGIGPNCQVSKFQWLVATNEPSGAIWQDLTHEGVKNVFVLSAIVGSDWKFQCHPKCTDDEWEFDGLAAFLQRHIG
jgi:hypothetical protein